MSAYCTLIVDATSANVQFSALIACISLKAQAGVSNLPQCLFSLPRVTRAQLQRMALEPFSQEPNPADWVPKGSSKRSHAPKLYWGSKLNELKQLLRAFPATGVALLQDVILRAADTRDEWEQLAGLFD